MRAATVMPKDRALGCVLFGQARDRTSRRERKAQQSPGKNTIWVYVNLGPWRFSHWPRIEAQSCRPGSGTEAGSWHPWGTHHNPGSEFLSPSAISSLLAQEGGRGAVLGGPDPDGLPGAWVAGIWSPG